MSGDVSNVFFCRKGIILIAILLFSRFQTYFVEFQISPFNVIQRFYEKKN